MPFGRLAPASVVWEYKRVDKRSAMGGYMRIIIAAIIWGSIGVVLRLINLPVPLVVFYRVFFAAVTILVYVAVRHETGKLAAGKNIYWIILMGALLALNWTSFFYAIKLTTIANAVLLTYTSPILVAILAPIVLKERLERITVITLLISLAGAVLIASPSVIGLDKTHIMGLAWGFVSAMTYAALVLIAKPLTGRVDVLAILFFEELSCAAVLSPSLFIYKISISATTLLILFGMGAIQTALSAGLYLSGLREVKAQQVGVFTYLDPVSATVFAAIFLHELPSITTLIGGALIIASGLILVLVTRERIRAEVVSE